MLHSWSGYYMLSFLRLTALPPNYSTFQISVNIISVKDFTNSINDFFSLKVTILFWNQLVDFKDHAHSSLIVAKKSWNVILKVFSLIVTPGQVIHHKDVSFVCFLVENWQVNGWERGFSSKLGYSWLKWIFAFWK
jgi:hypothetical protein